MNWFDRGLLLVLALGVWALVFKPSSPVAHHQSDDGHSCDFSWSGGYGELEGGGEVYVHTGDGSVDCTHY